ncbi:MAG: sulfatase [Verrucomicrobia bacterium]|nr:sulfatase [Verrucomicrobiota bacterium]
MNLAARLRRLLLVSILPGTAVVLLAAAPTPSRPNVLLIVSDDLNTRLGCYGAAEAKTPNLDRLAARGLRFDRAYCNYPVCNVSRTSFLSGRYPEVTGVLNNATNPRLRLGADFQFLPEYFRAHGYATAGCGKIAHGTFSQAVAWDYYSEPQRGGEEDDVVRDGKQKGAKKGGKKGKAAAAAAAGSGPAVPFPWQATTNADEEEPDGQVARRLLRYFSAQPGKPFFIAAGFHKPHIPHTAPKKYFDLHDPARMPTPPEPPGHEKDIPGIAWAPRSERNLTIEQRRAIIQHYYAAVSFMDAQVGILLAEMDRLNLWDSTLVVFMSDHGWHLGEHGGFYAKMSLMDESARAPFIVAGRGVPRGAATSSLLEYVDLFPTLVDLAGLPLHAGQQGVSQAPVIRDPAAKARESAYTIVLRGGNKIGRALHTATHTYLEWPDGSRQLYDAVTDPREYANLASQAAHAGTLQAMTALLAQRTETVNRGRP